MDAVAIATLNAAGVPVIGGPSNPVPSADQTIHAGEKRPTDTINGYRDVRTVANATVLSATTATVIGGSLAANDTELLGVFIPANATAITVTINGFQNDLLAAAAVVLTGSTSVDTYALWGVAIPNPAGQLTATASVAGKAVVLTRIV